MYFDKSAMCFYNDIAIDIGADNTMVIDDKGIIFNHNSIYTIETKLNKSIVCEAGYPPLDINTLVNCKVFRAFQDFNYNDFDILKSVLIFLIDKGYSHNPFVRNRIAMTIPNNLTTQEASNIRKSIVDADIKEFFFIDEVISAAVGSGNSKMSLVIDIGKTVMRITVFKSGKKLYSTSKISNIDYLISNCLEQKNDCSILPGTLREIKKVVAKAIPSNKILKMSTHVRDKSGGSKAITVVSEDIQEVVSIYCNELIQEIKNTLKHESDDVIVDSITLTGGGSLLRDLDTFIFNALNIPIHQNKYPSSDSANGAIKILRNKTLLKRYISMSYKA